MEALRQTASVGERTSDNGGIGAKKRNLRLFKPERAAALRKGKERWQRNSS